METREGRFGVANTINNRTLISIRRESIIRMKISNSVGR
jgi:hypothetical protein